MIIHCLYDELVKPSKLKKHPKNPNKHPKEQIERLADILKYQGFRYAVKVSKNTGFITSGHGRVEAAKLLKLDEVPVVFQDYEDDAQEYADIVADNGIASWSNLDFSSINEAIGDFGPDFDIDLLGLKNFTIEVADKIPLTEPDSIPNKVFPRTNLGDIYALGNHKLICGDSTSMDVVQKLMGDELADMVWTDPPYNIAYHGKTKESLTIENDDMDDAKFYKFLYDAFTNMFMYTKDGGAIYVAHADTEGINFRRSLVDAGFMMKQCLVWVKQTLVMGRSDYHWKHEPILYGWKPGASHTWCSDRKQTTVLEFDKPNRNAEHPTMKPVELVEYCINNNTRETHLVLDVFGGSGTTLIACEKNKRFARIVELDPKYCDVIIKRWEEYTGETAVLLDKKVTFE